MSFAADASTHAYYERRAREYDEWYEGSGLFGLDQSPAMVARAQHRLPGGIAVLGDALALPFADGAFDRVVTGHFYGHLDGAERGRFLAEVSRVAGELVVVDTARRAGVEPERWEERVLNDGSRHRVFKRYLSGAQLAAELGAETLFEGSWFVVGRARVAMRQVG
jgi:ubiquinone/menaquinone biosynthesis C-methylase UbiE